MPLFVGRDIGRSKEQTLGHAEAETRGVWTVTVIRDFIARHFLIGGDWGTENHPNSHHFRLELTLEGSSLDQHEYLVDITLIEERLDAFVARYRETLLNDHPPFANRNPSIELFCFVAWNEIVGGVAASNVDTATVTIWEHDAARASYRCPVGGGATGVEDSARPTAGASG